MSCIFGRNPIFYFVELNILSESLSFTSNGGLAFVQITIFSHSLIWHRIRRN